MLSALTRFTRPHTIIATTIQVLALFLIAGGSQILSPAKSLGPVMLTLLTCLALNIYIVGLNQITDVEIDHINKPRLPLASLEMSYAPRVGSGGTDGLHSISRRPDRWRLSPDNGRYPYGHRHYLLDIAPAAETFFIVGSY